jgi:hypothetical protein
LGYASTKATAAIPHASYGLQLQLNIRQSFTKSKQSLSAASRQIKKLNTKPAINKPNQIAHHYLIILLQKS